MDGGSTGAGPLNGVCWCCHTFIPSQLKYFLFSDIYPISFPFFTPTFNLWHRSKWQQRTGRSWWSSQNVHKTCQSECSHLIIDVLNSPFFAICIFIWNKSVFLNVWIKGMITKWMLVVSLLPLCCHSRRSIFSSFLCISVSICIIQIVCYIAFSICFVTTSVFSHGMSTWWLVVLSLLPLHRHSHQPKLSLVRNHACQ